MDERRKTLTQLVENSPLTPESKTKAHEIIADESKDLGTVKQEIITLISEELDRDLEKAGAPKVTNDNTVVVAAKDVLEREVAAAETDLREDMRFVDENLDTLGKIAEEVQVKALQDSL